MTYDCGDFLGVLKQALDTADYAGFNKRKRESRKRGLLRGIGIGCYLEVTAAPGKELGAVHFEPDGTVTIVTGTLDFGMGHATTYAQILTDLIGVPFDLIRMIEGDSDRMAFGGGSGGSRSVMFVGAALTESAAIIIERGKQIASHVLEASASDIEFKAGRFVIAGTDRSIALLELAARLRGGLKLPEGAPNSLDVDHVVKDPVPSAFPERLSCCRSRGRSRDRRRPGHTIFRGQRPRHDRQPASGRRTDPGRRRAGPWTGFCSRMPSTTPTASS
jgi:carbon-monoxide dehydrogenase large subunit